MQDKDFDDFDAEDWEEALGLSRPVGNFEHEEDDLYDSLEYDPLEQFAFESDEWNFHRLIDNPHAKQIKQRVMGLAIPWLMHFTRIENLSSIVKCGLLPRMRMPDMGIVPIVSDQHRLDGRQRATSLSIAFPNYNMFARKRSLDDQAEWVVLAVHPSLLWEKACAFYRHNAADRRIRKQHLRLLMTPEAFDSMFENDVSTRTEQYLKPYDPTDVQAEVLVFDVIEPSYILGVAFQTPDALDRYHSILGGRRVRVGRYFSQRAFVRRNDG